MPDLSALHAAAEDLAEHGRWREAAHAYARLGAASQQAGYLEGAGWAWDAAGEAWRRADRPVAAARALRQAIALGGEAPEALLARVKLAGVLSELGQIHRAERACRQVLSAGTASGRVVGLALDTLVGALQAAGDKETARALVEALHEAGQGVAATFRRGQLARLDGDLAAAARCQARVIEGLAGQPRGEGGIAAAHGELAEIALLRGDYAEALEFFDHAVQGQADQHRQSLAYRAEAGRVRAMVWAGVRPLGRPLEPGLALAAERGMPVLAIDLRIARGMARARSDRAGAAQDLDQAAGEADGLGLSLRAGRARLERAVRVPASAGHRRQALERALEDLAPSVPLVARASLELARVLSQHEPERARRLAVAACARFTAMGAGTAEREASELLRAL